MSIAEAHRLTELEPDVRVGHRTVHAGGQKTAANIFGQSAEGTARFGASFYDFKITVGEVVFFHGQVKLSINALIGDCGNCAILLQKSFYLSQGR